MIFGSLEVTKKTIFVEGQRTKNPVLIGLAVIQEQEDRNEKNRA